jgi:hypothetical protein
MYYTSIIFLAIGTVSCANGIAKAPASHVIEIEECLSVACVRLQNAHMNTYQPVLKEPLADSFDECYIRF